MNVRQALVFAAGPAQRLMPLTQNRPKAMLIVGGQPLLRHCLQALRDTGVTDVVLVVGHEAEKIQAFVKDGADFGLRVRYVHQAHPNGTVEAFRLALPELDAFAPVLVLPGHAYLDAGILAPLRAATGTTLLLTTAGDAHPQGVPTVRGERLSAMRHEVPQPGSTRVTTNVLVAAPDLLAALRDGTFAGQKELDLALGAWGASHPVNVAYTPGPWFPVVDPWDVLRLNEWVLDHHLMQGGASLPNARGPVYVAPTAHVAPTAVLIGPVHVGDGTTIEDGAIVGPYVSIRSACIVGAHCEVRRSILNNNVQVDSGGLLRGCILDDGVEVGPAVVCAEERTAAGPRGCIVGRDARIPARSTLAGGTVVPAESGR